MPKGKGKRSSSANETPVDTKASVPETSNTPAEPQIEEGAFAGLRQKIEQRLKDQSSGKGKGKKDNKPQTSAENISTKKDKTVSPKADKKQDSAHGKKRDRNGDVIAREEKGNKNKQEKSDAPKKASDKNDTLREEIMALGGTEEDLNLLEDIDSESEVEGATSKKGGDADLRKELSKMLEAAGHVVPEDLSDEEAEEEEADEDEEADEEDAQDEIEEDSDDAGEKDADSFEESDIEDEPPATKPKAAEVPIPKEYAKLVSCKTWSPSIKQTFH